MSTSSISSFAPPMTQSQQPMALMAQILSLFFSLLQAQFQLNSLSNPLSGASPQSAFGSPASSNSVDPFAMQAQVMAGVGRSQVIPASAQGGYGGSPPSYPSTSGAPTSTPTGGSTGTGPSGGPSQVMDLSPFNLQLPTGTNGKVDSVDGDKLKSYNSPYFQMSGGAMKLFAPVTGVHTANSHNPRTELSQKQSWKMDSGPHSLSASLTMEQVPSSKSVTIGQIHQRSGQRPPVMLRWKDGKVYASLMESTSPDAKRKEFLVADNVPVGQKINYKMDLAPNGALTVNVNGKTTNLNLDPSFKNTDFYFKAGLYVDDNQGPSTEGARATFTGLQMT